jgi:amidase
MSRSFSQFFRTAIFRVAVIRTILPAVILVIGLGGCAIPNARPKSATRDKAFIEYWPPANDSTKLRLAVKDLIDMKGVVTTAGSEYFAKHRPPAQRDASCLAIARQTGVQLVGKTNLSELAVAVSGLNAYYGTPRNPMDSGRIPGGSSSGSAVAVANNEADVAFGTDTAGSIRVPAAACGVVGLKTTFGLVPLDGVWPIAPKYLDTVGPIARDIEGTVRGMDLLQGGFSGRYKQAVAAKSSAASIRIGRLYIEGTNSRVDRAVDDALAATGFKIVNLSPEFTKKWDQAQKDAATVAAVGAWKFDRKLQGESEVTIRTKAVIATGGSQYPKAYREALQRQSAWKAELGRVFGQVDFIALPTLKNIPLHMPLFGGTIAFELRALALQNTQAVNFAGVPALAMPIPVAHAPVRSTSLQLIGRPMAEAQLLNAGRLVEAAVKKQ